MDLHGDLLDTWLGDASVLAPDAGTDLWRHEGALILAAWAEPQRRYHTLQHLAEMLGALGHLTAALGLTPTEARLARVVAFYHDLVYDPRAAHGSNEHRSATKARDHLHRLGVDDEVIDAVERGVLMTLEHGRGETPWMDAVRDADLWILGSPPTRYAEYRRQVREEYAHVPTELFGPARAQVLRGLSGGEWIYATPLGRQRWEVAARANLAAELGALD